MIKLWLFFFFLLFKGSLCVLAKESVSTKTNFCRTVNSMLCCQDNCVILTFKKNKPCCTRLRYRCVARMRILRVNLILTRKRRDMLTLWCICLMSTLISTDSIKVILNKINTFWKDLVSRDILVRSTPCINWLVEQDSNVLVKINLINMQYERRFKRSLCLTQTPLETAFSFWQMPSGTAFVLGRRLVHHWNSTTIVGCSKADINIHLCTLPSKTLRSWNHIIR